MAKGVSKLVAAKAKLGELLKQAGALQKVATKATALADKAWNKAHAQQEKVTKLEPVAAS